MEGLRHRKSHHVRIGENSLARAPRLYLRLMGDYRLAITLILTLMLSFTKDEFPTADLVLLTSDNEALHVHRCILEVGSPFFKGKSRSKF